eukprot:scaffold7675_cov277-Pinguiococcus_pyrenoidosus.AAC.6
MLRSGPAHPIMFRSGQLQTWKFPDFSVTPRCVSGKEVSQEERKRTEERESISFGFHKVAPGGRHLVVQRFTRRQKCP